ncbi:hypothetical protein EJ110_NYTH01488 [Nymphaea thermarum]|nr:hypothetical protein EJ110_NYTH01488 [Nymphaea thermarum]
MARLRHVAGEGKANDIISHAQYVVWNTHLTVGLRKIDYGIDSYISFLVDKVAEVTKTIYDLGARKIGISGLPALG